MDMLKGWFGAERRPPDSNALRAKKFLEQLEEQRALHRPLSTDNPENHLWSMSAGGASARLAEGKPVAVDVVDLKVNGESEAAIVRSHRDLLRFVQAQNGTPAPDLFTSDEIEALVVLKDCERHGLYDPRLSHKEGFLGLTGEAEFERLCRYEALEKLGRKEEVLVRGPSGREATINSFGELSRVFEKTVDIPNQLQELEREEQEVESKIRDFQRRFDCSRGDLEEAFELIRREREQMAKREVLESRDASLSVKAQPGPTVQEVGLTEVDTVTFGNFDLEYQH